MKKKKLLAFFLAAVMTASLGITALAQETEGNFDSETCELADGCILEKGHEGECQKAKGNSESEETESETGDRETLEIRNEQDSEETDKNIVDGVNLLTETASAGYVTDEVGWLPKGTPEGEGFTVEGDVLTYDDDVYFASYPEDRKFYRLYIETGDGVSTGDVEDRIWGESAHEMKTYLRDQDGNTSLWIRNHECDQGCCASVYFNKENSDTSLVFELSPASAGYVEKTLGLPILNIHLNAPATLKVSVADDTTIASESGATVDITGNYDGMEFVVNELTGSDGQEATAVVVASLGEGAKAIAYDIHLAYRGGEMSLQDGDTATVTLPVPAGWIASDVIVYHVGENGTLTDMKAVPGADGTTVSFTTTHFSTFVLAQKAQSGGEEIPEKDGVEEFVRRLYTEVLGRNADPNGLNDWTKVLKSGTEQGAKVAQGFIDSNEFKKRSLSDEEYITILYHTFLDREPDDNGLAAWQSVLDSGLSRLHVFKGFAESQEFTDICESYGIIRGNAELTAPMDQNENVTKFLVRCYRLCLDREADADGLNAWCSQILNGRNTAKEAAYGFVFSNEFKNKGLSDEEYIRVLYRVFMDREADSVGLSDWISVLKSGQSREHVFNGFADSVEFKEICAEYGIK